MTETETGWLAQRFEELRPQLRAVAYRMLGSLPDADDAVQESWIRVSRAGTEGVENIGGWLTTVVARVSLNLLRARGSRREDPLDAYVPDPVITPDPGTAPDDDTVLADSVGLALLVVLETLNPAERLAFVLHDMFAVPFEEIAGMLDRSVEATRQLASRARRRVRGAAIPDTDRVAQRRVVDAFFAAARAGDLAALVSVLHPDVVLRSDGGTRRPAATHSVRGATAVGGQAIRFALPTAVLHPVLVNGNAGVVVTVRDRPYCIMGFTVSDGRIAEIDILIDPDRLERLDLAYP